MRSIRRSRQRVDRRTDGDGTGQAKRLHGRRLVGAARDDGRQSRVIDDRADGAGMREGLQFPSARRVRDACQTVGRRCDDLRLVRAEP